MSDFFLLVYRELLPALLQVIAALLGLLLVGLANTARTRWGIEIEARHREALQSALMTGIAAALSRGLRGPEAVAAAIEHATRAGAPDAIAFFGLGMDDLTRIAQSKLQLQQPQPPMVMPDVGPDRAGVHG